MAIMRFNKSSFAIQKHWAYFAIALILIISVYALYGANIVWWRNSPDFGWRTMYDSGPNVVAEVMESGKAAGLRVGDVIQAINRNAYSTFDELYFKVRDDKPGSMNTYTILRDGKTLQITITNSRLGLSNVLTRSGPLFLIGLIYVFIGILVFLMNPKAAESWLFFVMSSFIGMMISLSGPSDLLRPLWVFNIRRLIEIILPAPMIHLALRFPKMRTILVKMPRIWIFPYLPGKFFQAPFEIHLPSHRPGLFPAAAGSRSGPVHIRNDVHYQQDLSAFRHRYDFLVLQPFRE